MKVMTSPPASEISLSTAFRRSSNSPRYLAPATMAPRSRASRRLPRRLSGTSPSTMRRARPSTMAVLPTPGSPMSTGLFLVRRDRTWTTRRISSSRPITGSSLPRRARLGQVPAVSSPGPGTAPRGSGWSPGGCPAPPAGRRAARRGWPRSAGPGPAGRARPTGTRHPGLRAPRSACVEDVASARDSSGPAATVAVGSLDIASSTRLRNGQGGRCPPWPARADGRPLLAQ